MGPSLQLLWEFRFPYELKLTYLKRYLKRSRHGTDGQTDGQDRYMMGLRSRKDGFITTVTAQVKRSTTPDCACRFCCCCCCVQSVHSTHLFDIDPRLSGSRAMPCYLQNCNANHATPTGLSLIHISEPTRPY